MRAAASLCFLLPALVGCAPEASPVAPGPEAVVTPPPATPATGPGAEERGSSEPGLEASSPAPAPAPDPAPTPEAASPQDCNPLVAPVRRKEGRLTVLAPPSKPTSRFLGRMRNHIEGALSVNSTRTWVGPQVPGFVPLVEGTQELFLLDHLTDEQGEQQFFAFYRDPYGASSCALSDAKNCDTTARLFGRCGEVLWTVSLNDHHTRPDHLEVQDIRVVDGTLYFNEACQSYSKEAKGKCSSLVAFDPVDQTVLWRTRPLVSNGRFFVDAEYIVAGYGFTAEKDTLSIVRRSDGAVMQQQRLPKAPENITRVEPGVLEVTVYPGDRHLPFRQVGWDRGRPKLQRLKP